MIKKTIAFFGIIIVSSMLFSGCIKKKPKKDLEIPEIQAASFLDLATPSQADESSETSSETTNSATTTVATTAAPTTTTAAAKNPSGVTLTEFNKLKEGMSYKQVVGIIGGEGKPGTETKVANKTAKAYTWTGETNPNAIVAVSFINDRLTSKTQIGL